MEQIGQSAFTERQYVKIAQLAVWGNDNPNKVKVRKC